MPFDVAKSDMQIYCDRCNETTDHPVVVSNDPELSDLLRDLGYRSVCPGCYDDLLVEAQEAREQEADDRRSVHRVPAQIPVRIAAGDGTPPIDTMTEDISENGAQIRANSELETGSVVRLSALDGSAESVAIVEVVWHDGDALRAGLRLVEPSDAWTRLVERYEALEP